MTEAGGAPAVAVEGLRKAFGATVAVDDVSFEIAPATVHALLGENGAGKSTIVKLLSGLIEPDKGRFEVHGRPSRLRSPRAAHALGIQTAFQEMTLVRDLTVLDNMLIPYAPVGPTAMIRRRSAEAEVRAHLDSLGFSVNLRDEVGDLDLALQQKIEIARAIYRKPKILLLDEPTSTLAGRDVDWLGEVIARLKAQGTTVVFISHRMREVRAFCDKLTVLRNGRHIATGSIADFTDTEIIEMIIGRSIAQTFPARPETTPDKAEEVFAVDGLSAGTKLRDASFSLRKGEILGVAGLQGMGQLDLFLAAFGMREISAGGLRVDGRPVTIASPRDAIRPNIALGLLPEDRKTEALFLKLNGRHNVSLPVIDRLSRGGLIDTGREREAVQRVFDRVEVDHRALWTRVGSFSGGNQQKIAVAKWLFAESRTLLLFDPTRGIDVGTKHELYVLMRAFAELGGSILFHSTEIPELVHLCDRVIVLYAGRIVAEIAADDLSEHAIMRAALGADTAGTEAVA
ncbi:MAG: sugar ABC transporter ATP-binding protein [Bauldia sp.]|uniref:sugar ABC transporter ATP-binding protein n=1 Tax=Bauldia sp. TaxID=2575872 RepID=UPI001DE48BDA|nr:sugar ABC transporter ATP-binding protein [Bauldia sp.]MCB1494972.1 sugar ABC transporter ATP-binding protein [Bauldia sp.]